MLLKSFTAGNLPVEIYETRDEMGKAAAKQAAADLKMCIRDNRSPARATPERALSLLSCWILPDKF